MSQELEFSQNQRKLVLKIQDFVKLLKWGLCNWKMELKHGLRKRVLMRVAHPHTTFQGECPSPGLVSDVGVEVFSSKNFHPPISNGAKIEPNLSKGSVEEIRSVKSRKQKCFQQTQ